MTQILQDVKVNCFTISGSNNQVKYYRTDRKEPMKVQEVKENIILCYHEELKIAFPPGVAEDQVSATI